MAVELDAIEKRGSYYYHQGESLAQGRENAKQFLREHPDVADEIETIIRETLVPQEAEPVAALAVEETDEAD